MKFLHFSDCHFDAPFLELSQVDNKANIRRNELKETFKNAIGMGKSFGVDVILISGDIFEHQYVNEQTINYINSEFSKIPQIKIFIAPGNHDPIIKNSYYNTYKWCENVFIFNSFSKVYLPEINTNIYGVGFNDFNIDKCLIKDFEVDEDKINILIAHGTLNTFSANKNNYNPIDINYLKELGLDYYALGHIHKPIVDEKSGICYSGSLEPLGFDELGEHGVILGEITKNYKTINFHPISKRKYFMKEVDVSGLISIQDVIDEIKYSFNLENYKNDFIKIILVGNIESTLIDIDMLYQTFAQNFYFLKIQNDTINPYSYEEIEKENNIKGLFVKRMRELIDKSSDEDREMLLKSLEYGLDALIKGQIKL